MFGLESDKSGNGKGFVFDLEKEVLDVNRYQEIVELVETRTGVVKDILRKGESQEMFNQLGTMLHGYIALLKVLSRIKRD